MIIRPRVVLAKSPAHGREITLDEHAAAVRDAAGDLFGARQSPTRLGREWLRFFGLEPDLFDCFLINLKLAALFHDLGKANDRFQASLGHGGQQAIRHEHLSALLLYGEPMRSWLTRRREDGVDAEIVNAAVVSHHLKVNHIHFAKRLIEGDPRFTVFATAREFTSCVALAAEMLEEAPPDLSLYDGPWSFAEHVAARRETFLRDMHIFNRALLADDGRRRLLSAVKAALIAADSAGSGLVREGYTVGEWIAGCFGAAPLSPEWLDRSIIRPRVDEIVRGSGRQFRWRDFQSAAGGLGPRALLLSGCGTGKTLAAWNWVKAQLARRPAARVVFLYPTRGTATEGFRDYVSWAGEADAALLHGTAAYDLVGLFENPVDPRGGDDYRVEDRLYALGYWPRRVFSATVDSFLAFMRNQYGPICMLPILADSIVVIDEVHSFDASMFSALERFLGFFDVPVLCMTASLPAERLRVLRDSCGLAVFPQALTAFEDLRRQSEAARYLVTMVGKDEALARVIEAARAGRRVLCVVNTVSRCQTVARDLAVAGIKAVCYHSRFRLRDRRDRHNEVISGFRSARTGAVVVSTQVCEMSLDLDADVLVTEVAPVPSLIQRMGRCCREPLPSGGRLGAVYAYDPPGALPYERSEIDEGRTFLEELHRRQSPVSHGDLAAYLSGMPRQPLAEEGYAGFLDSGWYAMSQDESFRDTTEFTVDAVLDADIDAYLGARQARDPMAEGFVVPVPRRSTRENPRLGYRREAPASAYDLQVGFLA
jgi:CRISPR-associated endonuclease/helicase Cas3